MQTCPTPDGALEYRVRGAGEPLLMIHGAIVADAFEPIAEALAARHRLITYRRRGFGGSAPARVPGTVSDQAADAVALLDHLGVETAHVGGHSYGGVVALQLALDAPERVRSLALLEPGLLGCVASAEEFAAGLPELVELYRSGDHAGTLAAFLDEVGGDDAVARISEGLPTGWYEQALADLPALFAADLASLAAWTFDERLARSIRQPALAVLGTATIPLCAESYQLLRDWLPHSEPLVLDGVSHLLPVEAPQALAEGMLAFFGRHPITAGRHPITAG